MGEASSSKGTRTKLIHYIDGFVFEESDEPFPATKPSFLEDSCGSQREGRHEEYGQKETGIRKSSETSSSQRKLRCKYCHGLGKRSVFFSDQYCSAQCAREHNCNVRNSVQLSSSSHASSSDVKRPALLAAGGATTGMRRLSSGVRLRGGFVGSRVLGRWPPALNLASAQKVSAKTHRIPHRVQLERDSDLSETDGDRADSDGDDDVFPSNMRSPHTSGFCYISNPQYVTLQQQVPAAMEQLQQLQPLAVETVMNGAVMLEPVDLPAGLDGTQAKHWTRDDVHRFLVHHGFSREAETLLEHDLDGGTLPFLTVDHLVMTLGLKTGPSLKLAELVRRLVGVG